MSHVCLVIYRIFLTPPPPLLRHLAVIYFPLLIFSCSLLSFILYIFFLLVLFRSPYCYSLSSYPQVLSTSVMLHATSYSHLALHCHPLFSLCSYYLLIISYSFSIFFSGIVICYLTSSPHYLYLQPLPHSLSSLSHVLFPSFLLHTLPSFFPPHYLHYHPLSHSLPSLLHLLFPLFSSFPTLTICTHYPIPYLHYPHGLFNPLIFFFSSSRFPSLPTSSSLTLFLLLVTSCPFPLIFRHRHFLPSLPTFPPIPSCPIPLIQCYFLHHLTSPRSFPSRFTPSSQCSLRLPGHLTRPL